MGASSEYTRLLDLNYDENIWKTAVECSDLGIWHWDLANDEMSISDRYYQMLGYEKGELSSRTAYWSSLIHPDDVVVANLQIKNYFEAGNFQDILVLQYRAKKKDDTYIWIMEKSKVSEYSNEGIPTKFVGIMVDIDKINQIEQTLRESEEMFRTLVEFASDGIGIFQNGFIKYVNKQFSDIVSYEQEEMINSNMSKYIHEDYSTKIMENHYKLLAGEKVNNLHETILYRRDGTAVEVEYTISILMYKNAPAVFVIMRDITERKKVEEKIRYLSFHDKLTGLYNRAFFEEELKRLDTDRNLPLSIIMGDVNGLKFANDIFGHEEGDNLLRRIANLFKDTLRKEDVIARIGGDEFAVILPKVNAVRLEEIINSIKDKCCLEQNNGIPISISLGYSIKTKPNQDLYKILNQAENKMYSNKLLESRSIRSSIITSLKQTLEERTHETEEHASRLKKYSIKIGEKLGLDTNSQNELELLCMLHDIGKIAIPDDILNKPGALTQSEREIMKKHSEIGYRIASATPELVIISDGILSHHERWDGKGYPQGLFGDSIPFNARIVSVVDAFDAMINDRVYKKAIPEKEALEEIKRCSGTQFDPNIVSVFFEVLGAESNKELVNY